MPIFTARFALALCLLVLTATLLMIGMWPATTGTLPPTSAHHGEGSSTTTWTGMLTPYIPVIMIMSPLITATAALGGVMWSSRSAERQRHKDEERRRRELATFLLGEIQVLYSILKDIHQAYYSKALHKVGIEPFHTAMYDQAGGDRLLFQAEAAQVLAQFYSLVSTLRMELIEFRERTPESRLGRDDALRFRTLYIAELIEKVMHKLSAEGGAWPIAFPQRTYTLYPEEPEDFPFPPFPEPPP
jgi:hypothetical protein